VQPLRLLRQPAEVRHGRTGGSWQLSKNGGQGNILLLTSSTGTLCQAGPAEPHKELKTCWQDTQYCQAHPSPALTASLQLTQIAWHWLVYWPETICNVVLP